MLAEPPSPPFSLQTTTAGTTATRQAAATPAPATSSSATAGAASPCTGRATGTTIVGTTVMKLMPTAPTRVSLPRATMGLGCTFAVGLLRPRVPALVDAGRAAPFQAVPGERGGGERCPTAPALLALCLESPGHSPLLPSREPCSFCPPLGAHIPLPHPWVPPLLPSVWPRSCPPSPPGSQFLWAKAVIGASPPTSHAPAWGLPHRRVPVPAGRALHPHALAL